MTNSRMPRAELASRREFLGTITSLSAAVLAGCTLPAPHRRGGIVDTHTHFYDPTRPQGVPWPPKDDALLYRKVLPEEIKPLAQPLGVIGTVVVEASPWVEDNQWVLDLAAREPFILGIVGHLKPGRPGFAPDLARFAAHPLFRGIRTGLWNVSITLDDPQFIRDLRQLADRDLALDVLVGPEQLDLVARMAVAAPNLRIVIDHCANVPVTGNPPPQTWTNGIRALTRHPNVFMKVSGLVEGAGRPGQAPRELEFYRPVLDTIWDNLGEDRLIFGSNWPVSARFAPYEVVLQIVSQYFQEKGRGVAEKYFAGNAVRVYRWPRRA